MFPILHGRHNLVLKGWYFPLQGSALHGSLPCYILGYRSDAVAVSVPGGTIFVDDTAVELRFPVPSVDLTRTLSVNLLLRSPSGRLVHLPAGYINAHTAVYPVGVGVLTEPGTWRYQMSLTFRSGTFYHLDAGKFRVKANILGVN